MSATSRGRSATRFASGSQRPDSSVHRSTAATRAASSQSDSHSFAPSASSLRASRAWSAAAVAEARSAATRSWSSARGAMGAARRASRRDRSAAVSVTSPSVRRASRSRACRPRRRRSSTRLPCSWAASACSTAACAAVDSASADAAVCRAVSRHAWAQSKSGSAGACVPLIATICPAMRSRVPVCSAKEDALSRARSRSHSSRSPNRSVSKRRSSSSSRSSECARRNRAKSPCGNRTTWKNCSALIPSRRTTASPISGMRVRSGPEPSTQTSDAHALILRFPSPRFLGRSCSGDRVMRNRREPTVASSSTCGIVSGAA